MSGGSGPFCAVCPKVESSYASGWFSGVNHMGGGVGDCIPVAGDCGAKPDPLGLVPVCKLVWKDPDAWLEIWE